MRLNFRQGIITYPVSGNAQAFLTKTGSYVNLRVASSRVDVTVAHKDANYLISETTNVNNAWGPIPTGVDCWLYWDLDRRSGARTFGFTQVRPITGPTQPTGTEGQHWFDTVNHIHYYFTSGQYREVIRVFAAKVNTSTFSPLGSGFTGKPYAGTQIGDTTQNVGAGRIITDATSAPIRSTDGTFFTTESDFFIDGSLANPVRLDGTIITGTAQEPMSKYQVVKFSDFGELSLASYPDLQTSTIAMLMDDLLWQDVGTVSLQGLIVNPAWNWATVGASLWVSTGGQLTDVDPHVSDPITYSLSHPPIGRVVTPTSIIFNQGLGGKGDKGEPGLDGGVGYSTADAYGVVRLSVNPSTTDTPIAVGDNDTRLTNKVLKAGDTMSGPLFLNADPTSNLGAATKRYVDTSITTATTTINAAKVGKAGDTMTGLLVLSGDPSDPLGAATKQYVDTAVSNGGGGGGSFTPAGPTGAVQYNNSGVVGGASTFVWTNTTRTLRIDNGVLTVAGSASSAVPTRGIIRVGNSGAAGIAMLAGDSSYSYVDFVNATNQRTNVIYDFTSTELRFGSLLNEAAQTPPVVFNLTTGGVTTVKTSFSGSNEFVTKQYVDLGVSNTNPMTTAGDIIIGGSSGLRTRLGVGSNNQVLTVVSGAPAWVTPINRAANPMTTAGDLILGGSAGTETRLALGSNNQVLTVSGGTATWAPARPANPMTTSGDLIVGGTSGVEGRLGAGSNGQVLTIASGVPSWAPARPANPMTTAGDIIIGGTSGVETRLPVGSNNQVLTITAGVPTWAPARAASPLTTAGDLLVGGVSGAESRLGIGSNGQVLTVFSGALTWGPARGANPMTTAGDIIIGGTSGAETRLAAGTNGQVLVMVGSTPAWASGTSAANVNPQTGTTFTPALTDAPQAACYTGIITMTNSSANVVTLPTNASVAFPKGTTFQIIQLGTGQTSVAAAGGVTLANAGSLACRAQGSVITAIKTGTNVWVITGDTA